MTKTLQTILVFASALTAFACASGNNLRHGTSPNYSSQSNAAPWAYDNFVVDKDQPVREENSHEFYYKHCDLSGNLPFYSKTAYECTEPY